MSYNCDNLAPPSDRERANAFAEILHELIRPDNGKCNQCGGHWLYRLDGTWDYFDGEHLPTCIALYRPSRDRSANRLACVPSRPSTPSSAPTTDQKIRLQCPTCGGNVYQWPDGDRVGFHTPLCTAENADAAPSSAPTQAVPFRSKVCPDCGFIYCCCPASAPTTEEKP